MRHPYDSSPQRDNFYGAVGLLVVAALACALMGSTFGFVVLCALIGVLWTRAQWARIVTLVIVAYVGLVSLLVSIFASGQYSFAGFVAFLIAAAIFWLLLRPGMNEYFGSSAPRPTSYVVPVMPHPGALPHLQNAKAASILSGSPQPMINCISSPTTNGSTQQQWARLQQQLQAERAQEQRDRLAESKQHPPASRVGFPWMIAVLTAFMCSYAWSVGGEFSQFIMLLVVPGYIAALVRWIPAREFFLAVLLLTGGMILRAQWAFVAPQIRALLQHHGPMVLAAIALLTYLTAVCYSGIADDCKNDA